MKFNNLRRWTFAFTCAFTFVCGGCTTTPPQEGLRNSKPLKILESFHVPLLEISGLAWRTAPYSKKRELLAIGDREFAIVKINWDKGKKDISTKKVDLTPLFKPQPGEPSDWEAVATDNTGRVFLIKEHPPELIVLSRDFKAIEQTVPLPIPIEEINDPSDDNSGIEGLLLLNKGHLIGLKEKKPLRLFEFAPTKEGFEGFRPGSPIGEKQPFVVQKKAQKYRTTGVMRLAEEDEAFLKDASEISLGPDGTIYLLSDKKKRILSLGQIMDREASHIKIQESWSLPKPVKQPEGLVIDTEGHAIVAIDTKKPKQLNLFRMSKLKD